MARGNSGMHWAKTPRNNEDIVQTPVIHDLQAQKDNIDSHWVVMPPNLKSFLLSETGLSSLEKLVNFWSDPVMIGYTRSTWAGRLSSESWHLAMLYLKVGMLPEAKTLTINGSFLHQCEYLPIKSIAKLLRKNREIRTYDLPLLGQGCCAAQTPGTLEVFLQEAISRENLGLITYRENKMKYVGNISDEWKSSSSSCNNHESSSQTSSSGGQIHLFLVEDRDGGQSHGFDIDQSMTLKPLFKKYAEEQCVSLRSLRFSYQGKTLFLSGAGKKTPSELNMHDQDIIHVHDMASIANMPSKPISYSLQSKATPNPKKAKSNNYLNKARGKGKRKTWIANDLVKEMEEYRAQHSQRLTKLHEEVEPQLEEIRSRLNLLGLKCQQPKQKQKNPRKKESEGGLSDPVTPGLFTNGKAGKACFIIQVGDAGSLYKTKRPSRSHSGGIFATIDLHGHTRAEALRALDEKVPEWLHAAMQGEYPWMLQVRIICGCGNQVLSEAVRGWIATTRNVGNAPSSYTV